MLVVQLSRIVLDILIQKDKVTYIFASQHFGEFTLLPLFPLLLCSVPLCGSLRKNKTTEDTEI